jgi:hypothetical protein
VMTIAITITTMRVLAIFMVICLLTDAVWNLIALESQNWNMERQCGTGSCQCD